MSSVESFGAQTEEVSSLANIDISFNNPVLLIQAQQEQVMS